MSKLTDLDNNLDTGPATENNLVEFPASTVYEDEFIMLSDIVPTESELQPELPNSFDDLMIGGEEVSTSDYVHIPETILNGSNDFYGNVPGETSVSTSESIPKQQLKKRGRKRKDPVTTSVPTTSWEDTQADNIITPKRTSKRGRKPKSYYLDQLYEQHEDKNITTANGNSEEHLEPLKKNTRKKTKKDNSLNESVEANTSTNMDIGLTKKKPGKRGRKKKTQNPVEIPAESSESTGVTSQCQNYDDDDDEGDVVLSKLKKSCTSGSTEPQETISSTDIDSTNKLDSTSITDTIQETGPTLADYEYNIDNVIAETPNVVVESVCDEKLVLKPEAVGSSLDEKVNGHNEHSTNTSNNESLLVEDGKRPQRRKAKQQPKYEPDSDEDPFGNYSDDDYDPGMSGIKSEDDDNDFSGLDDDDDDYSDSAKPKRKRACKLSQAGSQNKSPVKKGRPPKVPVVTTVKPESQPEDDLDDIEQCLESSVIKGDKSIFIPDSPENSNTGKKADPCNKEFENFLSQRTSLQVKKVSKKQASQNIPLLDIPTIEPTVAKKYTEVASQTKAVQLNAIGVQTSSAYSIKMSQNIELSQSQAEKACEFLNGILKTTSELGSLMTQKSEEFIEKKINTNHVKDTTKVDYCIKKAFLLFKLAKDNLTTMEENLEKDYEEFLSKNDLSQAIETEKKIAPKKPEPGSDSDCEIVEEPKASTSKTKPKFNPKTVFLNKELSIKIAKKTSTNIKTETITQKAMNVKGRHAVWLNDSIMVKKVNSSPSFLAQDSRNKKPPDNYVTEQMVNQFFRNCYRQQVLMMCKPYISPQWLQVKTDVVCNYFIVNKDEETGSTCLEEQQLISDPSIAEENTIGHDEKHEFYEAGSALQGTQTSPRKLFSLCTEALQKYQFLDQGDHPDNVESLFKLCVKQVHFIFNPINDGGLSETSECDNNSEYSASTGFQNFDVSTLQTLCIHKVSELLNNHSETIPADKETADNVSFPMITTAILTDVRSLQCCDSLDYSSESRYNPSTLKDTMIDHINNTWPRKELYSPKPLQKISLDSIRNLMFQDSIQDNCEIKYAILPKRNRHNVLCLFKLCSIVVSKYFEVQEQKSANDESHINALTIDNINTLTEEAFLNLEENSKDSHYEEEAAFENDDDFHFDNDMNDPGNNEDEDSNWESQVVLRELKSGIISSIVNNTVVTEGVNSIEEPVAVRIKQEVFDEQTEYDSQPVKIKTEPVENHLEMVNIPNHIHEELTNIAKKERPDYGENPIEVQEPIPAEIRNYDVETFESFVKSNKMMHAISECKDPDDDPIFSQSAYRARVQYEPDSDNEYNNNDNLDLFLISRDPEPNPVIAKGNLMESSSGDEKSDKQKSDKKLDKRKRGKYKRPTKNNKAKEKQVIQEVDDKQKTKDKSNNNIIDEKGKSKDSPSISEIAVLTRRMKERIRNEQLKEDSSNSESEHLDTLSKQKNKSSEYHKEEDKPISQRIEKKDKGKSSKKKRIMEDDIQCNNVDSTEQIGENVDASQTKDKEAEDNAFSGFTNDDHNDDFQKRLIDMYDRILPTYDMQSTENDVNADVDGCSDRSQSPLMMIDEPAEQLECEPTMPIFEDKAKGPRKTKAKPKTKQTPENSEVDKNEKQPQEKVDANYTDRNGWKCYPFDATDAKLYQVPYVGLDKLPEEFVETYFQYQEVAEKCQEDTEVDRLINLQSLHRGSSAKDLKPSRVMKQRDGQKSGATTDAECDRSSADREHYNELAPSDDEAVDIDDELPPPVPTKSSDNFLAKNSLMDDNDSETEGEGTKKTEREDTEDTPLAARKSSKANQKAVTVFKNTKDLVLTADKMMKQELAILHAPVVLDDDDVEQKYSPPKEPKGETKYKEKSTRVHTKRERTKSDDSSSEEEKQWVNTKEKLLKKMEKKTTEDTSVDDAKRAKLVTEFIERRDTAPAQPRQQPRQQPRRAKLSRRKRLEKEKQMMFLNNALFGDAGALASKKTGASYSKGRRNIRKVIDKKSLARSTVIANMDEFERKRRLNMKQMRLRELLGYDEAVNVLVINDELCLEYDFEELQPVVTVHPFFTKVMKAHQYEGVKFMWDACFESLSMVDSGTGGGGCILAHCMGLGKTLQVLALLHTVLTHPRVGMQRVLVCCPLSTVLNWVDEIHKWLGPVTDQIKVFELSKLKKTYERAYQLEDWYTGGGIFIVGYELFRSLTTLDPELDDIRPTIIKKITSALLDPGPDIVVCDEGHLLKNDSSVLAIAMSRVRTKRRIILTGTPMQNNLREYYCMLNFVKPNLLGTYSEYSNRFENPIMNGQHRDSREEDIKLMKQRTHILHKVLEGCLQRQEASVLYPYLPKKHEYTVFISLSACQADMYKKYLAHCVVKGKQSLLKDYNILQKIWSHPQVLHHFQQRQRDAKALKDEVKLEDDLAREDLTATEDTKPQDTDIWWLEHLDGGSMLDCLESSNKFVTVFKILKECVELDDKLLIFSTSLFTMDALEYFLKKINGWSLGQEYFRLDGSVPPEVRQKWCREFNAETNHKTKLFLISTRAGCLGLNMTAANRVIILDTSWNPAHDIQSIFRVYRFGQKKDCYIYRLVAMGTMEQKIYERAVTKQAVSCRVIDEQQIDRHYDIGELKDLYRFDSLGEGVAGGVAVGVRDVVLLRVARDTGALHAVHEHDSLLRDTREQELPEHERAAAWHQFQEEQAHKQIQNQLFVPGRHDAGPAMLQQALNNAGPSMLQQAFNNAGPSMLQQALDRPAVPVPPLIPYITDIKQEPLPTLDNRRVKPMVRIDFTPNTALPELDSKAKPGPKSKKGRKAIQCDIPIRPTSPEEILSTPVTIIPDSSDPSTIDMVKKIAEAIKRHKFNNVGQSGSLEASEVAKVVSSIICNVNNTSGNADASTHDVNEEHDVNEIHDDNEDHDDNDLLVPCTSKAPDVVSLTGEERKKRGRPRKYAPPVSLQNVEDSPPKRGRGRPRKQIFFGTQDDEPKRVPEFDARTDSLPETDGKTKRRAAVTAAEKNLDAVINIDSDDDFNDNGSQSNDIDYVPDDDDTRDAFETNMAITAAKNTKKENKTADDSIVLSDDERETVIPLNTSLLTNKNFIKIVAHTYLKGNPMLDIDAATLAAEYSTSKALKEYQTSKREIVSGPIYDIAVKVLGIGVLKKLNSCEPKSIEPRDIKPNISKLVTKDIKPNISHLAPVANSGRQPITEKSKMAVPKLTIKSEASLREPAPPPPAEGARGPVPVMMSSATQPAAAKPQDIVPVGMFSCAPAMEECILPDDELPPAPPAPAPPAPTPPAPSPPAAPLVRLLQRRRARQPMPLNKVTSQPPQSAVQPVPAVQPEPAVQSVPAVQLVPALPAGAVPVSLKDVPANARVIKVMRQLPQPAAPRPEPPPPPAASQHESISLDSDDEEPPPLPRPPPPELQQPVTRLIMRDPANPQQFISIATRGPGRPRAPAPLAPLAGAPQIVSVSGGAAPPAPAPEPHSLLNLSDNQFVQLQPLLSNNYMVLPASALSGLAGGLVGANVTLPPAPDPASYTTVLTHSTRTASAQPAQPGQPTPPAQPAPPARATRAAKSTAKRQGPVAAPPKTTPGRRAPAAPAPKPPPPQKPAPPAAPAAAGRVRPVRVRNDSSSSSSGSSRSGSPAPADPLSCLRDVVHIQAPGAQAANKPKPNLAPASKPSTRSSKPTNSPQPSASTNDFFRTSQPASTLPGKKSLLKPSAAAPAKPSKPDDSKLRLLGSFDLTDAAGPSRPSAAPRPGPASRKPAAAAVTPDKRTVVGSSKDIIIGGTQSNKSSPTLQTKVDAASAAKKNNRVIHITNVQTISPAPVKPAPAKPAPAPDAKRKAAAPVKTEPPQKRKPMRLEDFSLDDIEDIIELE